MGYRARIGKIPKAAQELYSGLTVEQAGQLCGPGKSVYRPPEHTELYELGKYCDFAIEPQRFYDFDVHEECESEFHIIGKEGMKQIIDEYHEIIHKNYQEHVDGKDPADFFRRRENEWNKEEGFGLTPYYLDEEHSDGFIVSSWQYEYAIFNLIYIYRSFDWENDYLIYSAW